jgi:hypothetical protein
MAILKGSFNAWIAPDGGLAVVPYGHTHQSYATDVMGYSTVGDAFKDGWVRLSFAPGGFSLVEVEDGEVFAGSTSQAWFRELYERYPKENVWFEDHNRLDLKLPLSVVALGSFEEFKELAQNPPMKIPAYIARLVRVYDAKVSVISERPLDASIEAPDGKVWTDSGTHALVGSQDFADTAQEIWRELAERMSRGLRDCTDVDCDICTDNSDDPVMTNPPMKGDDRAEIIARIKALKEASRPLVEKGNLTASEAVRFEGYMREISTLRYSIAKPWTTTEKIPSQEVRKSALPSEIILVARNELLLNPLVYGAIGEAAFGVHLNADTAVDRVMGDHDPQVSAQEFYDTFSGTREALRRYFGDTMVLYRAVGLQKKKLTTNWASTDAIARLYGDRIITEMFPVDNVVAVNVSLSGTYEELIVINDPLTTG